MEDRLFTLAAGTGRLVMTQPIRQRKRGSALPLRKADGRHSDWLGRYVLLRIRNRHDAEEKQDRKSQFHTSPRCSSATVPIEPRESASGAREPNEKVDAILLPKLGRFSLPG